jgi:hypothetical protein
MDTKTARIRALNDQLRQNFAEGIAVMTPGVAALGADAARRRRTGSFHGLCRPKAAITLSRKDWHSAANRAVL